MVVFLEKNGLEISKYLFQEGVCYAKKDYNLAKHPEIDGPNLQVIKLMQSLKPKEYVRETFASLHYYWYLTNDGVEFLRTFLNLPSKIVPATLKKQTRPGGRPMGPSDSHPLGPPRFGDGEKRFGDRDGYRGGPRGGGYFSDKGGAPTDYHPSFKSAILGNVALRFWNLFFFHMNMSYICCSVDCFKCIVDKSSNCLSSLWHLQ
ncbi:hypothetical protein V6N13_074210 [Hibiscus sabdariffa]|uniref:Plectin/eS10 N-terminal domain-containing protein n=1 Tax=Hibiscus sabdariffa TaxID=183260 RepID=A0ABR2U8K5_9ROSI